MVDLLRTLVCDLGSHYRAAIIRVQYLAVEKAREVSVLARTSTVDVQWCSYSSLDVSRNTDDCVRLY